MQSDDSHSLPRRVTRSSDRSMLQAHRAVCTVHDFHTSFAVEHVTDEMQAVNYVGHFVQQGSGRPVFWFASARIIADDAVFASSELQVVDATQLRPGECAVIGRLVMPPALPLSQVAELLVTADVVRTYVHLGSSLEMEQASPGPTGRVIFLFRGTHEFYTCERNIEPVAFSVCIATNGDLTVEGTDYRPLMDSHGTTLSATALVDLQVAAQSNVCPGDLSPLQLATAQEAAAQRSSEGYDAQGMPGGPYTVEQPPAGQVFGGYLKGCSGIVWRPSEC